MKKRTGFMEVVCDLDILLSAVTLAALVCITVLGVVMRYFVGMPLTWLEEVQLWFGVWIVFFAASAIARKSGHIAIDAFVGLFPRWLRKFSRSIGHVTVIVTLSFFGYYACRYVLQVYTSERVTNILHIPFWLIYIAVPISSLLMILTSLVRLFFGEPEAKTAVQAVIDETKGG